MGVGLGRGGAVGRKCCVALGVGVLVAAGAVALGGGIAVAVAAGAGGAEAGAATEAIIAAVNKQFDVQLEGALGNADKVREKRRLMAQAYRRKYPERVSAQWSKWKDKNKDRANAAQRQWHLDNYEKIRNKILIKRYGIDIWRYREMMTEQDGKCAVCNGPPTRDRDLDVDHCHATGKVRGLLCSPCNTALGILEDNPDRIRKLAAYAERAKD